MSDLHTLGVAALAALLQKKEVSAVELATRMLARLGGNPHHAFLSVDSEVTLAQARAAENIPKCNLRSPPNIFGN